MTATLSTLLVAAIIVTVPVVTAQSGKMDGQIMSPILRAVNSVNNNANGYNGSPLRYSSGDAGDAFDELVPNVAPIATSTSNRLLSMSPSRWLLIENPLLVDPIEMKRAAQSFTPWAGKRSEEGKRVFHSWAGKRSNKPFSNWAGKRDAEEAPTN